MGSHMHSTMSVSPHSLEEILLVHHSHTDFGYTSHPWEVVEQHLAFIDQAVMLCERNRDRSSALRFRWSCESSWMVVQYFQKRTPKQREAFLKCVADGDIEVLALPLQPTPLVNAKTIAASLKILDFLRSEGIPVSTALGADINGLNWPWADALLDAGIQALGMSMNFVCGGGLPRWTGFHWQSPSGRSLLCWQGTHYNQGAYWGLNHDVYPTEEVAPQRLEELKHYPYRKLLLQVTNIPCDNAGPHPRILDYLDRYNVLAASRHWPKMRTATLKEWFCFLENHSKDLPTYRGDWTDWWASGVASTPRETAALREAQRRLDVAERRGVSPDIVQSTREQIFLAAEHTWGASTSADHPWQLSSVAGLVAKQNLMYTAAYQANAALHASLAPDYLMHDLQFGSPDPFWRNIVDSQAPLPIASHPLRKRKISDSSPDWTELLGRDFAEIIFEEPANGKRSTWFEKGKFDRPEAHGVWPKHPQWKRKRFEDAKRTVQYEKDTAHIHLQFPIETHGNPLGVYILFPFLPPMTSVLADVGGTWADPRQENIPGACVNWWTVHGGILLVGKTFSLLWTPWDAPLVMFDTICPNPPKKQNLLTPSPTLISWAYHNYWGTNFATIHQGEVSFRYRIKYWSHPISVDMADAYLVDDPLPEYPKVVVQKEI